MKRWLCVPNCRIRGFTLIELVIALAISSTFIFGIVATIFQIYNQNERSTQQMQATQSVENAGYWLSHDVLMSQNTTSGGFPFILAWQDWDGNVNQVTYNLENDNLQRILSINGVVSATTLVAQSIDSNPAMTNYQCTDNGTITFQITSTIGSASETRTFYTKMRPESGID